MTRERVRVTVQLVSASDGSVQWSQTSQHPIDTTVKLQDAICEQIARDVPLGSDSSRNDSKS